MGAETAAPERVMTCNWGWRRRSAINIGGGCADFEERKRRRSEMWKQPTEQNDYSRREKKRHIIERIQGQLMERDMDRLKGWRGEREKINWKRKRKEKKRKRKWATTPRIQRFILPQEQSLLARPSLSMTASSCSGKRYAIYLGCGLDLCGGCCRTIECSAETAAETWNGGGNITIAHQKTHFPLYRTEPYVCMAQ